MPTDVGSPAEPTSLGGEHEDCSAVFILGCTAAGQTLETPCVGVAGVGHRALTVA